MRTVLIICSLTTVINAKPQRYTYNAGDSFGGASGNQVSRSSSVLSGPDSLNVPSGIGFESLGSGTSFSSIGNKVGGFGHGSNIAGSFGAGLEPEDHEMLEKTKHFVIGRPQKNYRVVFIKEPSSSAANVKLSAEYAPQEEKTVIYVLTKKDSTLKVNDIATPAPKKPSKPEVVFIKYKTEEEAHHVQQKIQAEYDKIEGTSEHTNGGIGEQQSVVGILGSGADGADGHFDGLNGVVNGGSSNGSSSSSGVGSSSYSSSGSSGIGESFGSGVIGSSSTNTVKSHIYLPPSN